MTFRDEILRQAMSLPPEDREYVADQLERSLPGHGFDSKEIADAWSREIDRRITAYDRGETTAIEFDAALELAQEALETHRSKKANS